MKYGLIGKELSQCDFFFAQGSIISPSENSINPNNRSRSLETPCQAPNSSFTSFLKAASPFQKVNGIQFGQRTPRLMKIHPADSVSLLKTPNKLLRSNSNHSNSVRSPSTSKKEALQTGKSLPVPRNIPGRRKPNLRN